MLIQTDNSDQRGAVAARALVAATNAGARRGGRAKTAQDVFPLVFCIFPQLLVTIDRGDKFVEVLFPLTTMTAATFAAHARRPARFQPLEYTGLGADR